MFMARLGVASASTSTLNGIVQTGGACSAQPLAQVRVTLFEATPGQPTVLGQAMTDASGQFSIRSQNSTSSSIFYVSANVWVANFGSLQPGSKFTSGRISELCGMNPAACPPGKRSGDPISPSSGYTVPSAGSQVLLHNGDPLYGYGIGAQPSFTPLMRLTNVVIDQAGNIWALNNWKPDFDIDACCNPGGDGVVIFVGLAPPPVSQK